jgi:hypothetical protein
MGYGKIVQEMRPDKPGKKPETRQAKRVSDGKKGVKRSLAKKPLTLPALF